MATAVCRSALIQTLKRRSWTVSSLINSTSSSAPYSTLLSTPPKHDLGVVRAFRKPNSIAIGSGAAVRTFGTSPTLSGLGEFFPPGYETLTEPTQTVDSGRPWLARDLRNKNNTDLHKLWYVLLKERNMLLTWKQEAKVRQKQMIAPQRLKKVRKSMAAIRVVLGERQRALDQAISTDRQTFDTVRSAFPDVDTGIRPQIGSEKAGRVARMRARPEHREPIPDDHPTLLGVQPPNRMIKSLKTRPMTKAERSTFRAELKSRRQEVVSAHQSTILAAIKVLDDDELKIQVKAAEFDLTDGWDEADLSFRQLSTLKEARERGIETIYQAKTEPVPVDALKEDQ
eukprot:m.73947 g.73947  ORF g.73947 m.73947 type:complete len:341 (+) comp24608_c0_seq1:76-1098(+)